MHKKQKVMLTIKITQFFVKLFAVLFFGIGVLLVFTILFMPIGFFMIPIGIAIFEQLPKYLDKVLNRKLRLLDLDINQHNQH
ncbi:hypothetical protein ACG94M_17365 [Acinetobacter guillouiae]|uniref:hypothetical protein n=1 Tax=Acinetobacter guillouiae TaxID=106649 RepID=UPI003AF7FC2C